MKEFLIIVDMQEGFIKSEQLKELVKKIKKLLTTGIFDVVVATKFINTKGSMYEELLAWTDMESDREQQICPELLPYIDVMIEKHFYSGVTEEFLKQLTGNNDGELPKRVFLAGVDTDCCVLATAISLFENNIRPIVLAEYTASTGGADAHQAGLQCLERTIGRNQIRKEVEITSDTLADWCNGRAL